MNRRVFVMSGPGLSYTCYNKSNKLHNTPKDFLWFRFETICSEYSENLTKVEPQWLQHLWDLGNLFETWVVRATEPSQEANSVI